MTPDRAAEMLEHVGFLVTRTTGGQISKPPYPYPVMRETEEESVTISLRRRRLDGARSTASGFTIAELLIAVAIAGIMASIAVPSFNQYKHRSHYTEAFHLMAELFRTEAAFHVRGDGYNRTLMCACPESSAVIPPGGKAMVDCSSGSHTYHGPHGPQGGCDALGFEVDAPIRFTYTAQPTGGGSHPYFVNYAEEDVDGDGSKGRVFEAVREVDGQLVRAGRAACGDSPYRTHSTCSDALRAVWSEWFE